MSAGDLDKASGDPDMFVNDVVTSPRAPFMSLGVSAMFYCDTAMPMSDPAL